MSFSVADYDAALRQKLQTVFPNTVYSFAEWANKESAKTNLNNNMQFPLISMHRLGWLPNRKLYSFPEKFFGRQMWQDSQVSLTATTARTMPVTITYQIDIESEFREQMDDLTSELLMFFELSPILYVNPSNINAPEPFRFDIVWDDGPIDNTDIMMMEAHGRIYRNTFFYNIPEARLIVKNQYVLSTQTEISVEVNNEPPVTWID